MLASFSKPNIRLRWLLVLQVIVLLILADQVYSRFFIEAYAAASYPENKRGWLLALSFWSMGILPSLWIPIAIKRPSQILLWAVYLMVYLPTAIVAVYSPQSDLDVFFMLLVMLAGVVMLSLVYRLPYLSLPRVHIPPPIFWLGLSLLTVFFYAVIWIELGSIIRIVSLEDIYIQRLALMDSGASSLAGYAQVWTPLIIMPLFMAYALMRKNWFVYALGILGTIFFFAVSAQRIFLAGPFLLIIIFLLFRDHGRFFGIKWVGGAMAAFTIPFMLQIGASRYPWLFSDLVLNRSFINSGVLSTWYFDFFSFNPKVNFADVRGISWFVTSPYSASYKEELGWYFWGQRTDPNAHFMADGFAQLGYTGVLIECAIAAGMLWMLDSVCRQRRHDLRFVVTAIAMQIPNFMNSAIHTALLGGGFLFGLALLYFVPSPTDDHVRMKTSPATLQPAGAD
jgi:hypothetical protein